MVEEEKTFMPDKKHTFKPQNIITQLDKEFSTPQSWVRKIPRGEDSSMTKDNLINNTPPKKGFAQKPNTHSLYLKYYNNERHQLVVVDFDEKTDKVYNSKLWKMMVNSKTVWCETNKGYHFYCKFQYLPNFSNETKISSEGIDVDLLKGNKNVTEMLLKILVGIIVWQSSLILN